MKKDKNYKTENLITKNLSTIIVLLVCAVIFVAMLLVASFTKERYQESAESYTAYEKATVTRIESETISNEELYENSEVGSQQILITINSGDYEGMTMAATNYLGALYGTRLEVGNNIVVSIYVSEGQIADITVYEYDRSLATLFFVLLFVVITIAVGRKKGALSLLGLIFTIICILFILLPMIFAGVSPILFTFITCIYVAVVSFTLLEGITKKTLCAMTGTGLGLLLSVLSGLLAQTIFKVNGMRMGDYVDALLQLKQGGGQIQLKGLLIAGMLIASLGAIMDVAMSIASSIQELVAVNPNLTAKEIFKSGMNIGQDMIGTMTNTLILAFAGSSFMLVLYIYSLNIPVYELLSSNLVATELVHSISSSIGVVLSVPLTVAIATVMYSKKNS